jgi:hypothetical protein
MKHVDKSNEIIAHLRTMGNLTQSFDNTEGRLKYTFRGEAGFNVIRYVQDGGSASNVLEAILRRVKYRLWVACNTT